MFNFASITVFSLFYYNVTKIIPSLNPPACVSCVQLPYYPCQTLK